MTANPTPRTCDRQARGAIKLTNKSTNRYGRLCTNSVLRSIIATEFEVVWVRRVRRAHQGSLPALVRTA